MAIKGKKKYYMRAPIIFYTTLMTVFYLYTRGILNLALKLAKAALVLRRCVKPIFYTREYEGKLKDKVEIKALTVGMLRRMISGRRMISETTNNGREERNKK